MGSYVLIEDIKALSAQMEIVRSYIFRPAVPVRRILQGFRRIHEFKTVLPALANEFIVLIKETSVSGYVGLQELTKGGDIIRSRTYSAFMPLIAVAVIYLVTVMFFSWLVSLLERRLKNSER